MKNVFAQHLYGNSSTCFLHTKLATNKIGKYFKNVVCVLQLYA